MEHFRFEITARNEKKPSEELIAMSRESYFFTARDWFDDYMIALEWDRPYEQKFYLPRRRHLYPVTMGLQKLFDHELDYLCVSLPPGVGKSTEAIMYLTFFAGNRPSEAMLGGSHSASILKGIYEECLRVMQNDEYRWKEIFPERVVTKTNAADMKIDIDKDKRFSTFQFCSIGSDLAGKVRAMGLLYCDDLIASQEEAMSRERLDKKWGQYSVDLKQRKAGAGCAELHIATRWSVNDIIGRIASEHENDERTMVINIPALDENGLSNFEGCGFTTQFYNEQKNSMDDASWRALYMGEPIEREGLVYEEERLNRYIWLPEGEPDTVLAVCDTKDKGSDYFVMPIVYKYGDRYYIEDIICDNGLPNVVVPKLAYTMAKHKVKTARFESNSAGGMIAKMVDKEIRNLGWQTSITTKYSTANKETRIIVDSAWVMEHCYFKNELYGEYKQAFKFLTTYTAMGRNQHDDVPDAFSMLADYCRSFEANVIRIRDRIW